MKKVVIIVIAALICVAVGWVSSLFQTEALSYWYPTLDKPALTPPDIVFPIAWTTLYILMGISIGLIIANNTLGKNFIVGLFAVQLLFNFLWSIGFFYLQNPLLGLMVIIILDILVAYYILRTYPVNKVSSLLFVPYLAWILFATYLNAYIFAYN